MRIAGAASRRARAATMAAPVGVTSSAVPSSRRTGRPASSSIPAGTGTGSGPRAPVRLLAGEADVELGGRDTRARDAVDRDLDAGERERRDRLPQGVER